MKRTVKNILRTANENGEFDWNLVDLRTLHFVDKSGNEVEVKEDSEQKAVLIREEDFDLYYELV